VKFVRLRRCFSLPCASSSSDFTSSFFSLHSYIPVERPGNGEKRQTQHLTFHLAADTQTQCLVLLEATTYTNTSPMHITGPPSLGPARGLRPGSLIATHKHYTACFFKGEACGCISSLHKSACNVSTVTQVNQSLHGIQDIQGSLKEQS